MGITVPLAAQVIETWFKLEDPNVVASLGSTRGHGGNIRISTTPPTATRPWKFTYRSVGARLGPFDEFLTAPEDGYWFGDMDGVIAPGEVVRGDPSTTEWDPSSHPRE